MNPDNCLQPKLAEENSSDEADADRDCAPCLECDRFVDHTRLSQECGVQSMTTATLAKCRSTATKSKRQLTSFLIGTGLIVLGLAIWIFDPLKIIINSCSRFREGTMGYEVWKKPDFPVNLDIYVFNVTNSEAFLQRGEKLKLEEVGPYLYEEYVENTDVKFNENGTVTFTPIRNVTLSKDFIRDPRNDVVVLPNIALIGLISATYHLPIFTSWTMQAIASRMGEQPFITITVDELLWGYEDPLVRIANTLLPGYIPFSKLGTLDVIRRQISSFTMKVEQEDPNIYSLENMDGEPGLRYWGYGETYIETDNGTSVPELLKCNAVRGTYDGILFPRRLPRDTVLWLYRRSYCRPVPLVFEREDVFNGLKVEKYVIKNDTMTPSNVNPENKCYCDDVRKACLPVGVSEITPCYYNIPVAMSFPHFLDGDEDLVQAVDGLSPDAEKHQSFLLIEPEMGVAVGGHSRIQTNLIAKTSRMRRIAAFHNIIIPLLWMDTSVKKFPGYLMFILRLAGNDGTKIQMAVAVVLLILGLFFVFRVIKQHYYSLKRLKQKLRFSSSRMMIKT